MTSRPARVCSPARLTASGSTCDSGLLTQALVHYAWTAIQIGDWSAAVSAGEEAASLARDTRQPLYGVTGKLMAALATALLGNSPDLEATLAASERRVLSIKSPPLLTTARLARGAAALGDGRNDDLFRHLWPIFDEHYDAFHRYMRWNAILDIAEAAARSGHAASLGRCDGRPRARRHAEQAANSLPRIGVREAAAGHRR